MRAGGTVPRLLLVDDEPGIIALVERFARELGFAVQGCPGGAEALALMPGFRPHVVIVDLRLPGVGGLDVLRAVRELDRECQVILMTGGATVDTAIEAVRLGALDYVSKPIDFPRVRALLATVRDRLWQRERLLDAEATVAGTIEFHGMIGRSPAMQQLFDSIGRLAPHARVALVTGETGTGKELVAKALHAIGPRREQRLVTVNCSAVVESIFESELFGHVRGAFTGATNTKTGLFEHADGGTLFLDEVSELTLPVQSKLLRAVENGEVQRVGALDTRKVDVHLIAATNRDVRADAAAGLFRQDLFYRLGIIEIYLPPLRDRREDIPYLTAFLVKQLAARLKRPITGLTAGAAQRLQEAPWPGNVRELRNVLEHACIIAADSILTEQDLTYALAGSARQMASLGAPLSIAETTEDSHLLSTADRAQIERVLKETYGNKTAASKLLGISRRSLYRWLARLDIAH